MPAPKTQYACSSCGYRSAKWLGKCPDCDEWNSFAETEPPTANPRRAPGLTTKASTPVSVAAPIAEDDAPRLQTGLGEFDRILGGGLVPGSVTLVGGAPGVGKSTLLTQVAQGLAESDITVVYASGEESTSQVRDRAQRLGPTPQSLFLHAETDLNRILTAAAELQPKVLVVDSVQTTFVPEVGGTPGNISQVREVAARLVLYAKERGCAVLLVGHVTKGGQLAGPRTLEHAVDTVVYFDGEISPPYRVLRAVKNRFGATGELGLFEMGPSGLAEVPEPSAALLADRPTDRAGTVVTCCLEGSRTLLLEVQALVAPGFPGSTRRTALGVDSARLAMLLAVLGKTGEPLHEYDAFLNVVGGVRIHETTADLAVCAALISSLRERPVPPDWLVVGEVGLTGELRSVGRLEPRLAEAARHGFRHALTPATPAGWAGPAGIEVHPASNLEEAIAELFRR